MFYRARDVAMFVAVADDDQAEPVITAHPDGRSGDRTQLPAPTGPVGAGTQRGPAQAIARVRLAPDKPRPAFEWQLRAIPAVLTAVHVIGDVDYELRLACPEVAGLATVLSSLRGCGGVEVVSAALVLGEVPGLGQRRPSTCEELWCTTRTSSRFMALRLSAMECLRCVRGGCCQASASVWPSPARRRCCWRSARARSGSGLTRKRCPTCSCHSGSSTSGLIPARRLSCRCPAPGGQAAGPEPQGQLAPRPVPQAAFLVFLGRRGGLAVPRANRSWPSAGRPGRRVLPG